MSIALLVTICSLSLSLSYSYSLRGVVKGGKASSWGLATISSLLLLFQPFYFGTDIVRSVAQIKGSQSSPPGKPPNLHPGDPQQGTGFVNGE